MDIAYERTLRGQGYGRILGADENGLGAIALPLITTAVVIDADDLEKAARISIELRTSKKGRKYYAKVNDSKKFDPDSEIPRLYRTIMESGIVKAYNFGWVTVEEMEKIASMKKAQILGYDRAIKPLLDQCDVVITGNVTPTINLHGKPLHPIIKADEKCVSVAIASILGKYTRDQLCREMDAQYPMYDWVHNKGYRSDKHFIAMVKYGLSPYHRTKFVDCQRALQIRKGGINSINEWLARLETQK